MKLVFSDNCFSYYINDKNLSNNIVIHNFLKKGSDLDLKVVPIKDIPNLTDEEVGAFKNKFLGEFKGNVNGIADSCQVNDSFMEEVNKIDLSSNFDAVCRFKLELLVKFSEVYKLDDENYIVKNVKSDEVYHIELNQLKINVKRKFRNLDFHMNGSAFILENTVYNPYTCTISRKYDEIGDFCWRTINEKNMYCAPAIKIIHTNEKDESLRKYFVIKFFIDKFGLLVSNVICQDNSIIYCTDEEFDGICESILRELKKQNRKQKGIRQKRKCCNRAYVN